MSAGKAVLDAEFSVGDLSLCNDTLTTVIDFIVKVCVCVAVDSAAVFVVVVVVGPLLTT